MPNLVPRFKATLFATGSVVLLLLSGFAPSPTISWEKTIAPGVVYRMELESDPNRAIHILRWNPQSVAVRVQSTLADGSVYKANNTKGRLTVPQIAEQTNAVAAINADFFPFTGDPLGLMVRDGRLISLPNPKRSVFAWGPAGAWFGLSKFAGTIQTEGGETLTIDGLNEECPDNRITLNSVDAGLSLTKAPSTTLVLKPDVTTLTPSTQFNATVQFRTSDATSVPVQPGQLTLVARGEKVKAFGSIKNGEKLTVKLQTTGFDWEKVDQAIGGGPTLVKDGKMSVDADDQGFNFEFYGKRHPRSAVGRTQDGDILFVVLDGRQAHSVGATLAEMAELMVRMGCRDAINLDGGGSSEMVVLGVTVNKPSDGTSRAVANAIVISGPKIIDEELRLKWNLPKALAVGKSADLTIQDGAGKDVANAEIIWTVEGKGWIDQGGKVTATAPGPIRVKAVVRGTILEGTITAAK